MYFAVAVLQPLCTTFATAASFPSKRVSISTKDTLPTDLDRHPLISVGGSYLGTGIAMLGLEYPLDRNRNWNIEIVYFRLFYQSGETEDGGLISFRRYLLSQDIVVRPSFHAGLPFHIGVALDATILKRFLYAQVSVSVPIQITLVHQNSGGMSTMVTLNARFML
ncbi:MAG: hypothetical protein IPM69_02740 [Ignavibacteria bacterium]|nr:hypothetical protein [Ignavibacteria bacterium]